jgi:hypothetical protein
MKFCKALNQGTHQILNHSKQTENEEDMRAASRERSRANFSKKLKLTFTHPLCVFSAMLLYL